MSSASGCRARERASSPCCWWSGPSRSPASGRVSPVIQWTETANFCGRCHQMGPELAAYEAGPHQDVTCGECHVESGAEGWIKAKINGTKQLIQVITGLYPQPVPPPDHASLPSVTHTCLRCHSLDRLATANLVTRTSFTEDETNTRQFVGLMIRPGSGDVFDVKRSVHWHVLSNVQFWTPAENAAKIDYVRRHARRRDRPGVHRPGRDRDLQRCPTGHRAPSRPPTWTGRWTASPATTGWGTRSPTRAGAWMPTSPRAGSIRRSRSSSARGCGSSGPATRTRCQRTRRSTSSRASTSASTRTWPLRRPRRSSRR